MLHSYSPKGQLLAFSLLALASGLTSATYASEETVPTSAYCSSIAASNLCEALNAALGASADLDALRSSVAGSDARLQQASLSPNPILSTSVENIAGTGSKRGVEAAETTATLSQPFELGGKRSRRVDLASSEKRLAQASYAQKTLDTIQSAKVAFIEVLAAKEGLDLAERRLAAARTSVEAARRRAQSGGGSAVEEIKAKLALSTAEMAQNRARRAVESAERRLQSHFAGNSLQIEAHGDIDRVEAPPTWETLSLSLAESPDLQRSRLESERRQASYRLEQAKASSDIEVSAGVRYERESGDTGVVLGLSVPLPLFDRNQGAIREAKESIAAATFEQRAESLRIEASLKDAHQRMVAAYERVGRLKSDILPIAEQGFEASNKAFLLGKLSYLEVLDAQRALFDAREEYVLAVTDYHVAIASAERVLGRGFATITSIKNSLAPEEKAQ